MFLRAGLEFARLEGDARHYINEGAGYVKDFFDLVPLVLALNDRVEDRLATGCDAYETNAVELHGLFRELARDLYKIFGNLDGKSERH